MIKRCETVDLMWREAIIDCMSSGSVLESRAGWCREVVGWSCRLTDPTNNFLLDETRNLSSTYAAAEMLWYLSQRSSVEMIKTYAPRYEQFANGGIANGAYGWRWANNPGIKESDYVNQFAAAIALLKASPNTRQAVVVSWDSGDVAEAVHGLWKDVPCTVALQFMIRGGRMSMVTFMRSNDVWLGMPYDVFCFTTIQRLMAAACGVKMGDYVHSVGSLHVYDKNEEACQKAAMSKVQTAESCYLIEPTVEMAFDALTEADNDWCRREETGRDGISFQEAHRELAVCGPEQDLLNDLVCCCWHKTVPGFDASYYLRSKDLARGLR